MKGDPKAVMEAFSQRDDVTLANPLGPPRHGRAEVDKAVEAAAANFRAGSVRRIDEVSRYSTPDLGYVVELEQTEARVPSEDMTPFSLRATMIFRREGEIWKVAHRHADTITTARSLSSVSEAGSTDQGSE